MKKERWIKLSFILVLCLLASSANALPVDGALSGWEPETISFDYTYDGRTLSGQIEFAVYDDYPGPWLGGNGYYYAYQITNSGSSNVDIDSFSVGILDDASVGVIGWDNYEVTDGVEPTYTYFSPDSISAQSAIFLFMPSPIGEGVIESDEESLNLLFSSPYAPTTGYGVIEGGSIGVQVTGLATPLPEPATILLLGIGGAVVTMMRKRNI